MSCSLIEKKKMDLYRDEILYIGEYVFNDLTHYYLCREEHTRLERVKVKCILALLNMGISIGQIVGYTYFANTKVTLSRRGFVPRSFSERIVEISLEYITGLRCNNPVSVLELFAGTGAIARAIKANCRDRTVELSLVERNTELLHHLAQILNVSIFKNHSLIPESMRFNLIVANPPYIPSSSLALVQRGLIRYEGVDSIVNDGQYRELIYRVSETYLSKGGVVVFEHWVDETAEILAMFKDYGIYGVYVDSREEHRFTALIKT